MKNLKTLKQEKQKKCDALATECQIFFAFSNQQLAENKVPLEDGDKYVYLGSGAFMPKSKVQIYKDGIAKIDSEFKKELKENKLRKQLIATELVNYECYYSGDITDCLESLGKDFTEEEVMEVYNEQLNNGVYDNW